MAISKFFLPWAKKTLTPFRAINKKIHEATGQIFPGGAVKNPPAGSNGSADFRPIGKSPDDTSGFTVQHLGDKK